MLPYIYLGAVRIPVYWLMIGVGTVGMLALTLLRRKKYGFSVVGSVIFTVLTLAIGLAGAKLLYILENLKDTLEKGIGLSGFSFFGSVFFIPLMMAALGFLFRLKPRDSLDAVAPCVAVMIGFIRVGCFFNGCCGGWRTPFGFHWPTQAVESVCDFMLLFLLLQMEKKERFKGWLYPTLIAAYSSYRFAIQFFRADPATAFGLTNGHFFAIGGMIVGGIWLLILWKKRKIRGENSVKNK